METAQEIVGGPVVFGDPVAAENGQLKYPVRITLLTGEPLYKKEYGWFVVDLSTLIIENQTQTITYNHEEGEVIGHSELFEILPDGLKVNGYIVPFAPLDRACEVIFRDRLGQKYEASPNLALAESVTEKLAEGETAVVNGKERTGPITVYSQVPVHGLAVCPYGTDRGTSVTFLKEESNDIMKKNSDAKLSADAPDAGATEEKKTARPDLEEFITEFGEQRGVKFYREGISIDDARKKDYEELKAANSKLAEDKEQPADDAPTDTPPEDKKDEAALKADVAKLKADNNAIKSEFEKFKAAYPRGEKEPLSTIPAGPAEKKPVDATTALAEKFKKQGVKK